MEQEAIKRKSAAEIREELRVMEVDSKLPVENPEDVKKYRLEAYYYSLYSERAFRVMQDEKRQPFVYRAA